MSTLVDILGSIDLIRGGDAPDDLQIQSPATVSASDALSNKLVAVYFSAHWCPPCQRFTPMLAAMYKKMKAAEIVAYFGRLKGMPRTTARKRAVELLRDNGLADWVDARCEALSKGMGQKVQILGTIIHDPDLVILDEPFSGLDPVNRASSAGSCRA